MIISTKEYYKEKDLSYTAGVIDSCSTIYLNKHNQKISPYPDYDLVIEINHQNNDLIYKIQEIFNIGVIKTQIRKTTQKIYKWKLLIKEGEAYGLIQLIKPYLTNRTHIANVITEYWEWRNKVADMQNIKSFEINEDYRLLIKLLNDNEHKYNSKFIEFIEKRQNLKNSSIAKLKLKILG